MALTILARSVENKEILYRFLKLLYISYRMFLLKSIHRSRLYHQNRSRRQEFLPLLRYDTKTSHLIFRFPSSLLISSIIIHFIMKSSLMISYSLSEADLSSSTSLESGSPQEVLFRGFPKLGFWTEVCGQDFPEHESETYFSCGLWLYST